MIARILAAIPLALVGAGWFFYITLPWPVALRWRDPARTSFMEYRLRQAEAGGESLGIRHRPVPLERISPRLRRAVIVAEDARFREHRGIDWRALREEVRYGGDAEFSWADPADVRALAAALGWALHHRDELRGRSTITQQLAKNLYFTPDRTLTRKVAEFVVARRLEAFLGKDRILELYLNTAEWGPGIFGAEAAARHYFGRSAAELTVVQAAALAATLPHPLTSNPRLRPGRMAWRRRLILARMGAAGPVETVPLAPPAAPAADSAAAELPPPDTAPAPPGAADADTAEAPVGVPAPVVPLAPPDTASPAAARGGAVRADTTGPAPGPPPTAPTDTTGAGARARPPAVPPARAVPPTSLP